MSVLFFFFSTLTSILIIIMNFLKLCQIQISRQKEESSCCGEDIVNKTVKLTIQNMRRDTQKVFKMTPHDKQVMMFSANLARRFAPSAKNLCNRLG
ncbi:hypothetical protein QVD17_27736 [Tagetes erecta]|uniref:Uncharacterized protein n=1 Tax=Tagetes erecta TaxID=13708 RepID=A0AAD8NS14_TARER|nr:hypothetical protein QVD17_27736 [Tagetes erecta]